MSEPKEKEVREVLAPHVEPDVVVVVGQKEFQEHSKQLRSWSEYFDGAFRTCERNQTEHSGRFEFPDQNPDDWEILQKVTDPFSGETIQRDNVLLVLPWLDLLCCSSGVQRCDLVISEQVLPKILTESDVSIEKLREAHLQNSMTYQQRLDQEGKLFFQILEATSQYDLKKSKEGCTIILERIFRQLPFAVDYEELGLILRAINDDVDSEFKDKLWDLLTPFIPEQVNHQSREDLLNNSLFQSLLNESLQRSALTFLPQI